MLELAYERRMREFEAGEDEDDADAPEEPQPEESDRASEPSTDDLAIPADNAEGSPESAPDDASPAEDTPQ